MADGFPISRAAVLLLGPGVVFRGYVTFLYCRGEVENCSPANSCGPHGLQVFGDARFGKIRAHPVPPYVGLGSARWGDEVGFEGAFILRQKPPGA